jgi:predicted RNase H-like HicB family nuclease
MTTTRAAKGDAESRPRYSMLIEWSDRDNTYVVSFPEWEAAGWRGHTDGKTYQEAAKKGAALLESYIMWGQQDGKLPKPALFDTHFYTDDDEDEAEGADTTATAQSR